MIKVAENTSWFKNRKYFRVKIFFTIMHQMMYCETRNNGIKFP